jgi:hypothetical protein
LQAAGPKVNASPAANKAQVPGSGTGLARLMRRNSVGSGTPGRHGLQVMQRQRVATRAGAGELPEGRVFETGVAAIKAKPRKVDRAATPALRGSAGMCRAPVMRLA